MAMREVLSSTMRVVPSDGWLRAPLCLSAFLPVLVFTTSSKYYDTKAHQSLSLSWKVPYRPPSLPCFILVTVLYPSSLRYCTILYFIYGYTRSLWYPAY